VLFFDQEGAQGTPGGPSLVPGVDYFGVTLNEVCLSAGREWWSTYDPLVVIELAFDYGKEPVRLSRAFGPSAIRLAGDVQKGALPHGFVVRNLQVLSAHPVPVKAIEVTVVLYKIQHTDYSKRLLEIAEGLSSALGLSAGVDQACAVGAVVMRALDALVAGGSQPIAGHRVGLNTSAIDPLRPHHAALLAKELGEPGELRVDTVAALRALRRADGRPPEGNDYVLYQVWGARSIGDARDQRFYRLFEHAREAALASTDDSWTRAKSLLISMYQQMMTSPALTRPDADRIFEDCRNQLIADRERGLKVSLMGDATSPGRDVQSLDAAVRDVMALT
jgi:hypothetical protein